MVTVFVEGAGRGSRADCQRGFSHLLGRAAPGIAAAIVSCGSRGDAFRKFKGALSRGENALLLVDSERPIREKRQGKPWAHLIENPDRWEKPENASDNDAHLMTQCMESWLIADPDALAAHFGRGFKPAKLPQNPKTEEVAKSDVQSGLKAATKETGKGEYRKTRDGFALIGKIDPLRVESRAPHAKRFFDILRRNLGAPENS